MRHITIKDIAKELGISKSTVSRALSSDSQNVSKETVRMVIEAAERMGYRKNEMAVNLRHRSTKTIGIVLPEAETSFYMKFTSQVQHLLQLKGYRLLLAISDEDFINERSNVELFDKYRVDGLLVSTCHNKANYDFYESFIKRGIPIVFFDRIIPGLECSSVRSDEYKSAFFLMEHLIYDGRKRILYLTGPDYISTTAERMRAYHDTLNKHHISYDPGLVVMTGTTEEDGAEAMEKFLDKRAHNDYLFARFHEAIEDDFIPATQPWYGIAEHTAFLGGQVDFTETTTFHHQICENFEDWRNLKLDRDNMWLKLVVDGMAYMRKKWEEFIPIRMRGADGPSDIANAIRGNDLFYDIYDEPEELAEMMKFCADAVNFTLDLQRAEATKINGGVINGFGIWAPGKHIGHTSEDFSTMISRDVYEEHFLPALQYCVKDCDSAMLHVHSLGERMIPVFAGVDNIKIMELSSDPNCARAVEVYRKYREELKNKTIIIAPTYEELTNMGDLFETNKTIIWYYAEDEADAQRALKAVEKYR